MADSKNKNKKKEEDWKDASDEEQIKTRKGSLKGDPIATLWEE